MEFYGALNRLLDLLKKDELFPFITPDYDEGTLLEFYDNIEASIHFQESGLIRIIKRQNGHSHICETTWEEIEKVPAFLLRDYTNSQEHSSIIP